MVLPFLAVPKYSDNTAPAQAANDASASARALPDIHASGQSKIAANDEGATAGAGPHNTVSLSAGGDVTIKEATNTYDSETKEVHGKAELSVVVQHQAAEEDN